MCAAAYMTPGCPTKVGFRRAAGEGSGERGRKKERALAMCGAERVPDE